MDDYGRVRRVEISEQKMSSQSIFAFITWVQYIECKICPQIIRVSGEMIKKVVHKAKLSEHDEIKQNLEYWLSKTPEERVEAVEEIRRND